jgi:hypothetical protein
MIIRIDRCTMIKIDIEGYDEDAIRAKLINLGFEPICYLPFDRKLEKVGTKSSNNTIFVRDVEFVRKRVMTAKKCEILDQVI